MIKPTKLRKDIYKLLDQVIRTGKPLEIIRRGKTLKIILESKENKLANLTKRKVITDAPEDYVHLDWSNEWKYST